MPLFIVDSHVHTWDRTLDRPWLADLPDLSITTSPDEYLLVAGPATRVILVESGVAAIDRSAEAVAASASGASWPGLAGIVAAAPPDPLDAPRYLEAITNPLLRGIRVQPAEAASWPATLGSELARRGLALDVLSRWDDPELAGLLRALPEQLPVVLNHALAPPIDAGWGSDPARDWLRTLQETARRDATVVKLSGLAPRTLLREPWETSARPFALAALATFGSKRCMFGSDWPMSSLRKDAAPARCLEFLLGLIPDPASQRDIAGAVAARIYAIAAR